MSPKNDKGVTLLEMLSYLALLGLILSVVYSVYYQFSRTLSAADRTMLKERSSFDAVRTMQNDIRQAGRVMKSFGPFSASDGALILLVQKRNPGGNRVIIYRLAESKNKLMRHEAAADRPLHGVSSRSLGYDIERFDFAIDEENANLLKVSVAVKEGPLGILRKRPLTFYAAMRNG